MNTIVLTLTMFALFKMTISPSKMSGKIWCFVMIVQIAFYYNLPTLDITGIIISSVSFILVLLVDLGVINNKWIRAYWR